MSNLVPITLVAVLSVFASPALADHQFARDGGHYDQVLARVISADPIYRTVRIDNGHGCKFAPGHHQHKHHQHTTSRYRQSWTDDRGARTAAGAIIGGVVGHQFGGGSGQDVATVAGALIGAGLGHRSANRYDTRAIDRGHRDCAHSARRFDHATHADRIVGYDVRYRLDGRVYRTQTRRHPGHHLPVDVIVRPRARR